MLLSGRIIVSGYEFNDRYKNEKGLFFSLKFMLSRFLAFLLLLKEGSGVQCSIISHVHAYSHVFDPACGAADCFQGLWVFLSSLCVSRLGLVLRWIKHTGVCRHMGFILFCAIDECVEKSWLIFPWMLNKAKQHFYISIENLSIFYFAQRIEISILLLCHGIQFLQHYFFVNWLSINMSLKYGSKSHWDDVNY